jgi:DNA-binding LacI/PurR family transcriptional regulator
VLVQERLAVARAQHAQVAAVQPDDLLDQVVHGHGCIHPIAAPGHRVTSVDVARRAGVSQSTVSLVLSGKGRGRISARTEEAVRRAAEELGYQANVAARALRTGSARTVGLVVPDVTNPFFGRVLRGAQEAAWREGYAVVLADAGNDRKWQLASLAALHALTVDGYLFFEVEPPPGRSVRAVAIETLPRDLPVVRLDGKAGTRAALEHLAGLGHRRIGHLAAAIDTDTFRLRRQAFDAVVGPTDLRASCAVSVDAARDGALALLQRPDRPTAIFADDDVMAFGVYLAAREAALAIPDDLSVVGFDDIDLAKVLAPPLTTVAADAEGLGAAAFAALYAVLTGGEPERERVLPVRLVVRGSTAPPRGR